MPNKKKPLKKHSQKFKKSSKSRLKVKLIFWISLIIALGFIKIPSMGLVNLAIKNTLPEMHNRLKYEQAYFSLWNGIQLQKVSLSLQPAKETLRLTSPQLDLFLNLPALILGQVKISKVKAVKVKFQGGKHFPNSKTMLAIQKWVKQNQEWASYAGTVLEASAVVGKVQDKKFSIKALSCNLGEKGYLKIGQIQLLNVPIKNIKMSYSVRPKDTEFVLEQARFAGGVFKGMYRVQKNGVFFGEKEWQNVNMQKALALFKHKKKIILNGTSNGKLQCKGRLGDIKNIEAKGRLVANHVLIKNLPLFKTEILRSHAPDIKALQFRRLHSDKVLWKKQSLFWSSMYGTGKSLSFEGSGRLRLSGGFSSKVNLEIPEETLENFSNLAQTGLTLDQDAKARATVEISGTLDRHQIQNFGSLVSSAVWKKVGSVF